MLCQIPLMVTAVCSGSDSTRDPQSLVQAHP
jgi:hypothetical protein